MADSKRTPTLLGLASSLLALSLSACGGTSTGNPPSAMDPGDGPGEATGGNCSEEKTDIGLDETTALGFSAEDVLAFAEATFTADITWNADQGAASNGLEGSQTELTLTVARRGEGARFVDAEPAPSSGGIEPAIGTIGGVGESCPDRVEIDVDVTLRTADGALDERFEAVLRARSGMAASLYTRLPVAELGGSFTVDAGEATVEDLQVAVTLTPFGTSGGLSGTAEQTFGEVASASPVSFATWPGEECRDGGFPLGGEGGPGDFTGEDVIDVLDAQSPLSLTWQGGAATELSIGFSLADGPACVTLDGPEAGKLRLEATAVASSADGRIGGTWGLSVVGTPDASGGLAQIRVIHDGWLGKAVPADSFGAAYGIGDVDLEAYDVAALAFEWTLSLDGQRVTQSQGSIAVEGGKQAACVNDPPPPEAGGMGSPGCAGTDFTTVETASF